MQLVQLGWGGPGGRWGCRAWMWVTWWSLEEPLWEQREVLNQEGSVCDTGDARGTGYRKVDQQV